MLITYTDITAVTADEEEFNSRYGAIVTVLTSNLQDDNIEDGSVQNETLGNRAITAAKFSTPQAWQAFSYQNGWSEYTDANFLTGAGYMKDHLGRVHLRGMVKGGTGTAGTTIIQLPVGYRPGDVQQLFFTMSNSANCRIDITTGGAIILSAGSATWVSLSGINFKAV